MARVTLTRGYVFWVNLDLTVGTEIRNTRPAVACNKHGARVVVVPITSNVAALYPGEAQVHVARRDARVLGDQLRSIDKVRLGKKIGRLSPEELTRVDDALRITLDL